MSKKIFSLVSLIIILFIFVKYEFDSQKVTKNVETVESEPFNPDIYPLYTSLIWKNAQDDELYGMKGYLIKSEPLTDVTNISVVTLPFEKYYNDILKNKGWKEDINMAAGGPGSAVIAYIKNDEYIVLQYKSNFGVNNENEPARCPCEVMFSIFSGSK